MITRRQLLVAAGLAGVALGAGACSAGSAEELRGTPSPVELRVDEIPETHQAVTASASIAWRVLTGQPEALTGNVVISPSSLALSLAMLGEGATGRSAESLDEAFGVFSDRRSKVMGALKQSLDKYGDLPSSVDPDNPPDTPTVHLANRVVVLDDADVHQTYLDRLATFYDTGVAQVERSRAKNDLSEWLKKHTAGLVEDTAIKIGDRTRLITQDTILFAASWQQEFENDDVNIPFTPAGGDGRTVTGMQGTFDVPVVVGASEDGGDLFTTIRLPYDDGLAMDVTLPNGGVHPSELLFALETPPTAGSEGDGMQTVRVTMPTSDVVSSWELLEPLESQGIDLSEMDDIFDDATTGQMAQQARLTVTARGTVGAASTEAELETKAPEIDVKDFYVDRPYLMVVRDTGTDWPLFIAIVNDPSPAAV